MKNFVITIARGFGSGGKQIGVRLSKKLGIPCYDSQILTMASDDSGINRELFAEVDEKLRGSYITKRLMGLPSEYIIQPSEKNFVSDTNLYNYQAKIIRELANSESCIIVGKCADHILRDYDNVVSVFVGAPAQECVKTVEAKMGVSPEEAARLISKTDKYRSDYYKYYSGGKQWNDPINYDIFLNSSSISWDDCVNVIIEYAKIKLGADIFEKNQ